MIYNGKNNKKNILLKTKLKKNSDERNRFHRLFISNTINSLYKNEKNKKYTLSKKTKKNTSLNKSKNKPKNFIYILNNKMPLYRSRNTSKKIYDNKNHVKGGSKNSHNSTINSKTKYNFKKVCKSNFTENKKAYKTIINNKVYKREYSSNVLYFNKENENKFKIKKESLYSNNTTKRGTKKIISKDPIKAGQDKYKDKEIKNSIYYFLNYSYSNKIIKQKLIKDLKIKAKKITKNRIFKKNLKNCDISLKKNNMINMILPLNNIKDSSIFKYHSYKNVCKKILGDSKNMKINKKKYIRINRILFDDHLNNYTDDDEFYGDILESNNYNNNKIINEIKTNNFEVKKPKEQEMKYTIFNGLQDKEESNDQESHISKIIIGEINGYKDIIEKDKIMCRLSNKDENENLNEIKKLKDLLDESNESERKIIDMIPFEYDDDNMPINDFKIIQKNKNKDKTRNNNKFLKSKIQNNEKMTKITKNSKILCNDCNQN
jgi:hypothetical protein